MKYISTRGGLSPLPFKEAVMMGLATDGGLLLPETIPVMGENIVASWKDLPYRDLAYEVMSRFTTDIPEDHLRDLIDRSYSSFSHPEITPVVRHGDCHILELFHGPTLAFKDVALQFLGNVFAYLLKESGSSMNILGATSGDTGSAAIYGVRGKERINIFILHPYKRVSPIQELQMTTVTDPNVFNIAIRGTFDDGQAIVKSIFNDISYKEKYRLGAINSINWARILAQVVYYVYAYFRVSEETGRESVVFSVPTGNFGDIFAGLIARKMLSLNRIGRLVLATNENNLLTRFVMHGDYSVGRVVQTSSPSMDIQVASNFERYLYLLYGENPEKTRLAMETFAKTGNLSFSEDDQQKIRADFHSASVSEAQTTEMIRDFYDKHGYVLDPHTAVGVKAGLDFYDQETPLICLATAHPAKFGDAVVRAIGRQPEIPESIRLLAEMETRCEILEPEIDGVKTFLSSHAV